ncbi:MAG: carboxymuconolactone decarboxylase family protein [bacterium]
MSRLPELSLDEMNEDQRRIYEEIASGPRGGVRGPFLPLLRNPELAECAQKTGAYLRFRGLLPARLRELAVLITARFWTSQYEWNAHAPIAAKNGLGEDVISAVAERRRPDFAQDDEAVVYDYCTELHETHQVSDATYQKAVELFGEPGLVELTVLLGHYTTMAMLLLAFQAPLPEGAAPALAD